MVMNNKAFVLLLSMGLLGVSSSEPERAAHLSMDSALQQAQGREWMVVTANGHASDAARRILQQGGNAMDAAIAAALVLNVVEPQSSGIGGSAFLLYFDGNKKTTHSYDGREEAPASAHPAMFLKQDGQAHGFHEASSMGIAVGIPGALALMEEAHRHHGALAWRTLFADAIALARDGFTVSPRLAQLLADSDAVRRNAPHNPLFHADGTPRTAGDHYTNEALANTLALVRDEGSHPLYHGTIRNAIIEAVANAPHKPTTLTSDDFASYRVRTPPPLCDSYRSYRLCSVSLPTSGGMTLMQILTMLQSFPLDMMRAGEASAIHVISEASRLAYEDRAFWLADDRFAAVPIAQLLDDAMLHQRSQQITMNQTMSQTLPSFNSNSHCRSDIMPANRPSTTHISIIDASGNSVSLTASVGPAFGSGLWAAGFFLNGELTDFALSPHDDKKCRLANEAQGGKRPLSSMTPLIVFNEEQQPVLVAGSAGGMFIIAYLARVVTAILDFKESAADALALPHHVRLHKGALMLEKGRDFPAHTLKDLRSRGTPIQYRPMTSGLHVIFVDDDGTLHGAADSRREGVALGQ